MCFLVNVTKMTISNTTSGFTRNSGILFPDIVFRIKSIFHNILRYTLSESRIFFSIDFYNSHSKILNFFRKFVFLNESYKCYILPIQSKFSKED